MHNTSEWISLILFSVLMSTSCMAWTVGNQAGLDHRLQNSINRTVGADIVGDCVGGGVFGTRIVAFYSRTGCGNACPYYFSGSGSYSGDHFAVFDAVGSFTAYCGGISCGEIIALANDDYYRTRTFVNANHCVGSCNSACGK